MCRYNVAFTGMVLPGDECAVTLKHTSMRDGNLVIKIATKNQRGETVIQGTAEVAQPETVYVFTGQGSQEVGMGMEGARERERRRRRRKLAQRTTE